MVFNIADIACQPGSKSFTRVKVCTMSDGGDLEIPIHVVTGAKSGPSLCFSSSVHGGESFSVDVAKEIVASLDPSNLSGTLVCVPIINPVAFEASTRFVPALFSGGDLMLLFPGNMNGWLTEKIAYVIWHEVLTKVDYLIDNHPLDRAATSWVYLPPASAPLNVADIGNKMAQAYGLKYLISGFPARAYSAPGSAPVELGKIGKPSIVVSHGSEMYNYKKYLKVGVRGVYNVMRYLKMLPGELVLPEKQIKINESKMLRARHGGILYPRIGGLETQGHVVSGGTILAEIVSPYTFKVLEEIVAPYDESVLLLVRDRVEVVPGSYAYHVGNMKTAEVVERSSL